MFDFNDLIAFETSCTLVLNKNQEVGQVRKGVLTSIIAAVADPESIKL